MLRRQEGAICVHQPLYCQAEQISAKATTADQYPEHAGPAIFGACPARNSRTRLASDSRIRLRHIPPWQLFLGTFVSRLESLAAHPALGSSHQRRSWLSRKQATAWSPTLAAVFWPSSPSNPQGQLSGLHSGQGTPGAALRLSSLLWLGSPTTPCSAAAPQPACLASPRAEFDTLGAFFG